MKRKKIKKLCWRKNNTNNEEDLSGINLNRIQSLPLSSLSGSASGNITWCPSLVLSTLLETTSYPQSVAVSFRLPWSPLFCLVSIPSAQGPGMFHLMP